MAIGMWRSSIGREMAFFDKSDKSTNPWHRVFGDNISSSAIDNNREGQLQLCSLLEISSSLDAGRRSKLDDKVVSLSMSAFHQGHQGW